MEEHNENDKTIDFLPLSAGLEIGSYRLIRELGMGGMGQVFLAEDTRLERKVALKFLTSELSRKDEFRQRFLREARSAARLNHNNIVTIHDVGEAFERAYISMEYVEGRTLRQLIDTRALTYGQKLDVFTQVCQGLKAAHDAGIVHRDLKPANIMATEDGQVKILDFGLAKGVVDENLTTAGTAMGTVNYMSPEQAQGAGMDRRSDLFSAGTVLFELLAGVNPFVRGHMPATIHAIVYEPVGFLSSYAGDLPADCQTIIDKAVAKKPSDRYQSVAEFLEDIGRLRSGTKIIPAAVAQPAVERGEMPSMAVLFLRNLGKKEDEYLCHGITEDLIVDLSRLGSVRVLPMYKIVKYKNADIGPDEIARKLNVTMILDGSLHRSGDVVRISAQLVDVSQDEILWSNRWEESADSLPKVKTALARGISSALDVDSSAVRKADVGRAETSNPEAYDLYLKGKYAFDSRKKRADVDEARRFFDRALELEPTMIAARVGLSEILIFENQNADALELLRPALEDARRHRMRADEARVRVAMGCALNRIRKEEEAIEQLESAKKIYRGLKDASGEARALSELMKPLLNLGRSEEALSQVDRLHELSDAGADGRWIAEGKFLHSVAVCHFRNDAALAKSIREEALQLAKAHSFHTLTGQILAFCAITYATSADIDTAISYLEEARYLGERLGDKNIMREVDFNASLLELESGAFRQFYMKAERLLERIQDSQDNIATVSHLTNWASAAINLGKYDEAMDLLASQEKAAEETLAGTHKTVAQIANLELRALVLSETGKTEEAINVISRARTIVSDHDLGVVSPSVFCAGGEILFGAGDWQKAGEWFETGLERSKKAEFIEGIVRCTGHLGLMRYKENPDPEALRSLRRNYEAVGSHSARVLARRLLGHALLEYGRTEQERGQGRRELLQALGLARKMEWVLEMNRIQEVLDRNE